MANIPTPTDIQFLIAIAKMSNFSLSGNYPMEDILRHLSPDIKSKQKLLKKKKKEAIKNLLNFGYIIKKPRGRNITYRLTKEGLQYILNNV